MLYKDLSLIKCLIENLQENGRILPESGYLCPEIIFIQVMYFIDIFGLFSWFLNGRICQAMQHFIPFLVKLGSSYSVLYY